MRDAVVAVVFITAFAAGDALAAIDAVAVGTIDVTITAQRLVTFLADPLSFRIDSDSTICTRLALPVFQSYVGTP
jgi:hypothetical protein